MSKAYIKELRDNEANIIYPVTAASAVYMPNGHDTIERYIGDKDDHETTIVFEQNKITKTLKSGSTVVTEFGNGTIKEVTKDSEGTIVQEKNTTFKDDGSIEVKVV